MSISRIVSGILIPLLMIVCMAPSGAAAADAPEGACREEGPALKSPEEKVSYAIGVEMGRNLRRQGASLNADLSARGLKDAFAGENLLLSDGELQGVMKGFVAQQRVKLHKDRLMSAMDNRSEGEAFLAENRQKEGVVTLESGLQYRVLREGKGRKPAGNDRVRCRYLGRLINGIEFENTERTGEPAVLELSAPDVIPGLKEALKRMPAGSKWEIFIPPQLAYGGKGAGRYIGPNATLIYEMELMDVHPGTTPDKQP